MGSYDQQLQFILDNGELTHNRTDVDCLTVFGTQARYRIDDRFPILTGRRLKPQAIFAELLWFLSGSTNVKDLQAMNSHIWDEWDDRDWQRSKGYVDGCLGPVYGFQMRHFGGNYGNGGPEFEFGESFNISGVPPNKEKEFTCTFSWKKEAGGTDQIYNAVELLKSNPDDRGNLICLWNSSQLKDMKLRPCHVLFQLYVDGSRRLSGHMYQRSCDAYLGQPANIYSYSALLYMLAQQADLEPYEFIHSVGNHHIYLTHLDAVQKYLKRPKPASPRLRINKAKNIFSYRLEDFVVEDYNPLGPIKAPIAI